MISERFRNDTTTVYTDGTDLVFERTFDAPRERVWQAFTDPARIPRWWGPHGTTTTVAEMDVRVGGAWRYISHASDRDDVVFHGTYLEIEPPERCRWTFLFDVDGPANSIFSGAQRKFHNRHRHELRFERAALAALFARVLRITVIRTTLSDRDLR